MIAVLVIGLLVPLSLTAGGRLTQDPAGAPVVADQRDGASNAPQVYKMQAFTNRIDNIVDELRADFVLKVPHGYVNPVTGALQSVDGKQLRIGYDWTTVTAPPLSLGYINTFGAAGADRWARNADQYFTIHKVITSGKHDFLVISVEGDMNIPDFDPKTNVVDGQEAKLNWYFGYAAGSPNASAAWTTTAETKYPATFRFYQGRVGPTYVSGPMIQMQFDAAYSLWTYRQANWGQVLDYGLNGRAAGVLPPNSVAIDLVNFAYNSTNGGTVSGPAGSVSDSFWYAWVHEDGSLVESINTAPIHITGVPPSFGYNSPPAQVSKNTPTNAWTLARTPEQEAQGLTNKVGTDGSIDFNGAGGTGYYRLVAWPESRDPQTVTNPSAAVQAPRISYTAQDLFSADGKMTAAATANMWTPGSAYFRYHIDLPEPPVITTPAEGQVTNENKQVVIEGTGTPGHTITLKWAGGETISDTNDPSLQTLVDGDHAGVLDTDVVVDETGHWTYTYHPTQVLVDGKYTVVALQTEHKSGYDLTSPPSNPDDVAAPTSWGVTFTVDTVPPNALTFPCLASPTNEMRPTFRGSGVEPGARVVVFRDATEVGTAIIDGANWSFTPEEDLPNGDYVFTVRQIDAAGNVSAASVPPCALQVAADVRVDGIKRVRDVAHGDPALPPAEAGNWEVVAESDGEKIVLNGEAEAKLERDRTYTITEHLRSTPAPSANTEFYALDGRVVCTDGNDEELPSNLFDPETGLLSIGSDTRVAEPVRCTLTNTTSHVSFVTHRVGGSTDLPSDDWQLTLKGTQDLSLNNEKISAEALPDQYDLDAATPAGLSLVGIERLDLTDGLCAAAANAPASAPESCWEEIRSAAGGLSAQVAPGTHDVFRVVAAAGNDMPGLPLTGGLGSFQVYLAAATVLAGATSGLLLRRWRMKTHSH